MSEEIETLQSIQFQFPTLPHLPPRLINATLDGSQGLNRDIKNRCQIRAHHDMEAIQCWLNEYSHKPTTLRSYQKEAERFLLWCLYQKQKPFSSIDREDIDEYINFLDDPQPVAIWCAPPGGQRRKRGCKTWRPFKGPLSTSTKFTALSILDSLFSYLVQAHYLAFNPMGLIRKKR